MSLKDYTANELLEELARRNNRRVNNKAVKFCDECKHFKPYSKGGDAPVDYNPCSFKHKLSFRYPEGAATDNFGFYRLICTDREAIALTSNCFESQKKQFMRAKTLDENEL